MKRLIPFFASLILITATLQLDAFWGRNSESLPDQRDAVNKALLWVPDTTKLDWNGLLAFLDDHKDARFTLALAPEEIPEDAVIWLTRLVSEEKIEIALRIPGDPILPLANKGRPRLAAEKISLSRFRYKKLFGANPAGFVPGGGALLPSDAAGLPRLGISWSSVGDGQFANAWYGDNKLVLIPFHAILSTETAEIPPATDTAALVIDEVAGAVEPGSGLALIEQLLSKSGDEAYTTVSAGLAKIHPYVVGPESWPSWRGNLEFWNESEAQQKAWALYYEAARAVDAYQNSGSASIPSLDKAEAWLTRARSAQNFVAVNLRNPLIEKAFRTSLTKVYKALSKPAPRALRRPLVSPQEELPVQETRTETSAGDVIIEVQSDRVTFTNPDGSTAALPEVLPELAPGTTASHFWTPRFLDVAWNESAVDFKIALAKLSPSEKTTFGFEHLIVDLYIDLNHLSGRGSTALLSRRQGFLNPDDAWEYVLIVSGSESGLYRSLPGHPPSKIADLTPEIDWGKATLTVSVPRRRLRGNPAAWGYVLTTMIPREVRRSGPLRPALGETGSPLLGMLGSLEEQHDLTTKRESTYRRFKAQRTSRINN